MIQICWLIFWDGWAEETRKKMKTNHDLDTFCGSACALHLILTGPARWAWHRFLTQQDSEDRSIGTLTKEILSFYYAIQKTHAIKPRSRSSFFIIKSRNLYWLVVWNILYFSIYWECHHPIWQTHIFQRGRSTTNQFTFAFAHENPAIAFSSTRSLRVAWSLATRATSSLTPSWGCWELLGLQRHGEHLGLILKRNGLYLYSHERFFLISSPNIKNTPTFKSLVNLGF